MRLLLFCLIIALIASCTGSMRNYISAQSNDSTAVVSHLPTTPPPADTPVISATSSPPPTSLSTPPQWQGNTFIVLPKQPLVQSSGYELFTCKKNHCDSATTEATWELPNHRIRCEMIAGDSLFTEAIEPDGDEWQITFFHLPTNKRIYGRTHKQAIAEIVFAEDLGTAYHRWVGKTIFSKRGVISVLGKNSTHSITSLRINIQDSLFVTDVRWGMTPLPVKPIWIMVTTATGKSGFIPVRSSWTNTMVDHIVGRTPWDEDIFEQNPAAIYHWDETTWELINNHRVILEMTPDQVRISWGIPSVIVISSINQSEQQIWTYTSHELIFTDNKLTSIKELPLSPK